MCFLITTTKLSILREKSIREAQPLCELSSVTIQEKLPHEEKVLDFIEQIRNPYCFLSGETPVMIRFENSGKSVVGALERVFSCELKE